MSSDAPFEVTFHPASKRHELAIAARAFVRARRRRDRDDPGPGLEDLERLARELPADAVAQGQLVEVKGNRPPWTGTGVVVEAGERVSTFATGRVTLARALDVWFGPNFQLWMRVGDLGPVFRGTRATHSFEATAAGELELASYFPGEWADPSGRLATDPADHRKASGSMHVLIVRWQAGVDPAAQLRAVEEELARAEVERLTTDNSPPEGWRYLWFLGDAEIFTPGEESPHIVCRTHTDAGILRRDVELPLTAETRLRWRWRVDRLPSELPEDTLPTHDYISIAVEFDNGQDITWHWSEELPAGYAYRCPLPTWTDRETHIVVRSGRAELGRWLQEDRPIAADYRRSVGEPPARIVRVWLIANSLFQRREGIAEFADIELVDGDVVTAVR